MSTHLNTPCTAFAGTVCLATGALRDVALAAKQAHDRQPTATVLVFDDASSETIELDWRGSADAFTARLAQTFALAMPDAKNAPGDAQDGPPHTSRDTSRDTPPEPEAARGPGRPKLGVVAREVTLLPRHWEWLATQPGGASVALRKLVEVARRANEVTDRVRHAQAVGYKFMSTMAGHEPYFEEASRALFAGDQAGFEALIGGWPADIQTHLKKILTPAFQA